LSVVAEQFGVKRKIESDEQLRQRLTNVMKSAGHATKDQLFYAISEAAPGCGVAIIEETQMPQVKFGFFARLFFRKAIREIARNTHGLSIYIYVPAGVQCDASKVSDACRALCPVGIKRHLVFAGAN
jgi:hypothetical protein